MLPNSWFSHQVLIKALPKLICEFYEKDLILCSLWLYETFSDNTNPETQMYLTLDIPPAKKYCWELKFCRNSCCPLIPLVPGKSCVWSCSFPSLRVLKSCAEGMKTATAAQHSLASHWNMRWTRGQRLTVILDADISQGARSHLGIGASTAQDEVSSRTHNLYFSNHRPAAGNCCHSECWLPSSAGRNLDMQIAN